MTEITGSTSDGYHTFDELYEHRHRLFLLLMKAHSERAWASRKHSDGTSIEGWFLAGMTLRDGHQVSYHLPDRLWGRVERLGVTTDDPPEWDGHTSDDVLKRLEAEFDRHGTMMRLPPFAGTVRAAMVNMIRGKIAETSMEAGRSYTTRDVMRFCKLGPDGECSWDYLASCTRKALRDSGWLYHDGLWLKDDGIPF